MLRHGQRMFDVNSKYVVKATNLAGLSSELREFVRDWYCMSPYLWNGTLALGCGRPDIRIGQRLHIPASSSIEQQTFYVEGVNHAWSMPAGTRTTVTVTRGYKGQDSAYVDMLQKLKSEYLTPPLGKPTAPGPGNGTVSDDYFGYLGGAYGPEEE